MSSRSHVNLPKVEGIDKILHACAYAGLVFVARPALMTLLPSRFFSLMVAFLLASGYGATDEWHQSFVRGRASDITDWYADILGAGAMTLLLLLFNLFQWIRRRVAKK